MPEIELKTRIDSVIIYTDRVLVTRTGDVRLEGPADIIIPDLPGGLDDQTVRVRAKGLKFGEIQVRPGYERELTPRVKKIEDRLKTLRVQDRALVDEQAVLAEKQKFLASISTSAPQTISRELFEGKVSADAWRQGLTFVTEESLKARQRVAAIEREGEDLKLEIDALNQELEDVTSCAENYKTLAFDALPEKAQDYHIEIAYVIYGATWRPYYDLRANPSLGKIDLAYFGKIRQTTGEDWTEVSVTLSTSQPAQGGEAPEPVPWYIDLYQPEPVMRAKRAAAAMSSQAPAEAECDMAAGAVREEYAPAPPVESGISIMYPLSGKFTVASGDAERKVKICDKSLAARFEYFIMPRYAERAYLTGTVANASGYLFLPGEASTYVGDDLTGRVNLPVIAPDEEVRLSFGVDERVKVQRQTLKSTVGKGGLVKKVSRYEYAYENVIANYHDQEIKCEIVDQLPVPRNPEIKIQDAELNPRPQAEEKERGIFRWKPQIPAKGEFKMNLSFAVEMPPGSRLQGI